jgi:hypothetical protein
LPWPESGRPLEFYGSGDTSIDSPKRLIKGDRSEERTVRNERTQRSFHRMLKKPVSKAAASEAGGVASGVR